MRGFLSLTLACGICCQLWGQVSQKSSWSGVWSSSPGGLPGETLTLAEDDGELGGTIVFFFIRGTPDDVQGAGTDPHVVKRPKLEGGMLSFQVMRGDGKLLQMAGKLVDSERLEMRCLNCGDSSAVTTLVRFVPKL